MNAPDLLITVTVSPWLARFAKLIVLLTFALIFIGGHTTTSGAGMAFPDWPLSHGSFNPEGWWSDLMERLEHSHRLAAETVGLLIGVLCAWVWRSKWSIPVAIVLSLAIAMGAKQAGAAPSIVAHLGLWSSAIVFALLILWQARRTDHPSSPAARWLAFGAFLGVVAQAVLGGLRVTVESGGDANMATAFRVIHGCFAQIELCLLVCLAAVLSPVWPRVVAGATLRSVRALGWVVALFVFAQLAVGATMRHLGAGLAIPTFPHADPSGAWLPRVHSTFIDLNFTHTRIGAALVTLLALSLAFRAIGHAQGDIYIIRPAALLVALIIAQVALGILVVWEGRPPIRTTLHVVNGAAVLATTVLLASRAGRAVSLAGALPAGGTRPHLAEVPA